MGFSPVVGVQTIALAALLLLSFYFRPSAASFRRSSLLVTVIVFSGFGLRATWETIDARQRYPLESLADRLRYEDRWRPATTPTAMIQVGALTPLEEEFRHPWYTRRNRLLRMLHQNMVGFFINADGFGVMRLKPTPADIALDFRGEPIPIPVEFQSAPAALSAAEEFHQNQNIALQSSSSAWHLQPLDDYHKSITSNFVFVAGLGYAIDRDHAAGFQPHALGGLDFPFPPNGPEGIAKVELVSLLRFDQPRLYLSDFLPRMEQLRDAPTRPLDPWEAAALDKLTRGEMLVVQQFEKQTRMLGAIRAAKHCLTCHSVGEGHLLGAFSYELRP
jgi:hypothetical protein